MFRYHEKVHRLLRPGGDWSKPGSGPGDDNSEEWADVDSYLGLFERIKILVDDKVVNLKTIYDFYGYRLFNIVANEKIRREKLEKDEKVRWQNFTKLWKALEKLENENKSSKG